MKYITYEINCEIFTHRIIDLIILTNKFKKIKEFFRGGEKGVVYN